MLGGPSTAKDLAARFSAAGALSDALRRQPIVEGRSDVADQLAAVATVEHYEAGEVFIEQGRPETDIFFILLGSVVVSPNGRDDMVRNAHNHVGEMATIDPSAVRSATVRAASPTVVARVAEAEFSRVADSNPNIWRHLARELAGRLRQRVATVPARKEVARVFIASSSEALSLANDLKGELLKGGRCEVNIWTDDIFVAGMTNIEALERELPRADFAVVLLSPDDRVLSRWRFSKAPRDNLVLELGMFIGSIGRHRAIMVHPRRAKLKIPTDLLGVTPITYVATDMTGVAKEMWKIIAGLGGR